MSVSNGQIANETTFNNAFVSRTVDTSTTGKLDLQNADVASGSDILNVQRELNANESYTGMPAASAKNVKPVWASTDVGTATDSLTARAEALTAKFNAATGHAHSGAAHDGAPIDASNLINTRLRGYFIRATNLTAVTGSSVDVSTIMAGKTQSTGDAMKGVVVSTNNKCVIRDAASATQGDQLRDANGDLIYARLTFAAGVWTLSFYKNVAGTQTAHSFTAQDIAWYYQELYNPISDAPIYNELVDIPSDNATQDVVDASTAQRGLVSTGAQSFAGNKTFTGTIGASNLSGTNTGDEVDFTGDTGTGGVDGLVPAPAAGDAALRKVLGAGGGWVLQGQNPHGRVYTVDGITYTTIQSAVNAAEASTDSDVTDLTGCTVRVPAGLWAEDVLIKKNVHIVGDGLDMTIIQSITYRPLSSLLVAGANRISNCTLQALKAYNETAAGSGIFNNSFYGSMDLEVSYSAVQTLDTLNAGGIDIKHSIVGNHGPTDIHIINSIIRIYYCEIVGDVTNIADNSRLDLPTAVGSLLPILDLQRCMCTTTITITTLGTSADPSYMSAIDSFLLEVADGDNTQVNIYGGHIDFRSQTGTNHFGTQFQTNSPFTPAVPANWTTAPTSIDAALQELAARAATSGGGGGSLQWVEDVNAPVPAVENHARVYLFTPAAGQVLYARVKVPSNYNAGSPVKLKTDFYSPDSSGTALVQTVATLIRQGTDAVSSTTNQRTSTNTAITLGVGTVNKPQALSLDLSDSTGKINGVSIAAGDFILIALQLGTMTATSDVRATPYESEVTYQ
jgi:hypothetical protein